MAAAAAATRAMVTSLTPARISAKELGVDVVTSPSGRPVDVSSPGAAVVMTAPVTFNPEDGSGNFSFVVIIDLGKVFTKLGG